MNITQATVFDIDPLTALFDAYRVFYGQESDLTRAKKFLFERFQNLDSVVFLAKTDSGKAVGFAQLYPTLSSISTQRAWILNDLFVEPAHRQLGIGERLIEEVMKFGKASGARYLTLQTAHENHVAQKLYERLGWSKESEYLSYNLSL